MASMSVLFVALVVVLGTLAPGVTANCGCGQPCTYVQDASAGVCCTTAQCKNDGGSTCSADGEPTECGADSKCCVPSGGSCAESDCCCGALTCMNGVCQTSTGGDPLIVGFSGHKYYFDGVAGKIFNLISEAEHQVNFHLVEAHLDNHLNGGTFIDAIGFQFRQHTVEASVDEGGAMTVVVNGKPKEGYFSMDLGEDAAVLVAEHSDGHDHATGTAVTITTPMFTFTIKAIAPFMDPVDGYSRGHIDTYNLLKAVPAALHGVLGRSWNDTTIYDENDTKFPGPIPEMAFEVHALFGNDFEYNLFPSQWYSADLPLARARKLIAYEYTLLAAPLEASLVSK